MYLALHYSSILELEKYFKPVNLKNTIETTNDTNRRESKLRFSDFIGFFKYEDILNPDCSLTQMGSVKYKKIFA